MKQHNRVQERLPFPARADQILERIRIITRELEVIQTEVYGRMGQESQSGKSGLLDDANAAQVLGQFRTALDHARHMLWLCTEAVGMEGPLRERKLAQAAALLRALTPADSQVASSPAAAKRGLVAQSPASFFDRLDRVIDNYVEDGGNLVKPDSQHSPKTKI
jgi:hypothetical protein